MYEKMGPWTLHHWLMAHFILEELCQNTACKPIHRKVIIYIFLFLTLQVTLVTSTYWKCFHTARCTSHYCSELIHPIAVDGYRVLKGGSGSVLPPSVHLEMKRYFSNNARNELCLQKAVCSSCVHSRLMQHQSADTVHSQGYTCFLLINLSTFYYTTWTLFTNINTHIKSNSLCFLSKPNKFTLLLFSLFPIVNFE
jgi:hypothetical protein